jgi:hypothetical protein
MPATVIFKSGFPNLTNPVETSASIGADGLVTGSAVFLVGPPPPLTNILSTASLSIGTPISTSFFSGLRDVVLQGLFIETRNLEKRNGLTYLRLGVVGALNPPIVEIKRDVGPRGFSKSKQIDGSNVIFSFDYQAESYSASTVLTRGQVFNLTVPAPTAVNVWNIVGGGPFIRYASLSERVRPPNVSQLGGGISATGRVLTTESSEERAGIVRLTKTAQFIYE